MFPTDKKKIIPGKKKIKNSISQRPGVPSIRSILLIHPLFFFLNKVLTPPLMRTDHNTGQQGTADT